MRYEGLSVNGGPALYDGEALVLAGTADEIREYLSERAIGSVEYDADGNGSHVRIPVVWIGDGGPLHCSPRCLALIA